MHYARTSNHALRNLVQQLEFIVFQVRLLISWLLLLYDRIIFTDYLTAYIKENESRLY